MPFLYSSFNISHLFRYRKFFAVFVFLALSFYYFSVRSKRHLQEPIEIPILYGKNTKVNKILILAKSRSGTNFLGDLLAHSDRSFYYHEPFIYLTCIRGTTWTKSTVPHEYLISLWKSLFDCRFDIHPEYLTNIAKVPKNLGQSPLGWNSFFNEFTLPEKKFDPQMIYNVCMQAVTRVIKDPDLDMKVLEKMKEKDEDLKIIHLVRDPRARFSSLYRRGWCVYDCANITIICKTLKQDLEIYSKLSAANSDKFIQIKYEDLAMNPELITQKLFKKLKLNFTKSLRNWIKLHTSIANEKQNLNPYSTFRNSKESISKWMKKLTWDQVNQIQQECEDVLSQLNYSKVNKQDLVSEWNIMGLFEIFFYYLEFICYQIWFVIGIDTFSIFENLFLMFSG